MTALVGTVTLLGGCARPAVTTTPESSFRLEPDTVAVVGYSPQVSDMSVPGLGDHGYLVAIGADGGTQVLRTASMTGMTPNWDGDTVYSRDPRHSRTTTTRGTVSTDDSADILQDEVYQGIPGYSSVEQYDLGMVGTTDGMVELRARRDDGRLETERLEASVLNSATCDDGIYGFSNLLRSRESPERDVTAPHPTTLIRIFPRPVNTSDPRADVIATATPDEEDFVPMATSGVCQGSTLYYFGETSTEEGASLRSVAGLEDAAPNAALPYMRTWDTQTGVIHDIPLARTDGLPLSVNRAAAGPGAIVGGEIFWYSPIGTVFATRLDSGATRIAFATEPKPINVAKNANIDEESVIRFGGGRMFRFSSPTQGTEPGSLTSWDLSDGTQELDIALPVTQDITGETRSLQIPWGMAVRPDLLTPGEERNGDKK